MLNIGAYSPEIRLSPLEEVFEQAKRLGFTQLQYDFITSHGEEMPAEFYPGELERISAACKTYGIRIISINGTFNMLEPDLNKRAEFIRRFELIARACRALDCKIITLCTGSRSSKSMWTYHPDTADKSAWAEMIDTTKQLLPVAEKYQVYLGVETEASNVVCSIERTRKYLDEIGSPWLKVIMDCANLFQTGTATAENVRPTIRHAFDLLGKDIILAHGKDICESEGIRFTAPGKGIVDYDFYFGLLKQYGYDLGLILHGIHDERDFEPSVAFIREKLQKAGL